MDKEAAKAAAAAAALDYVEPGMMLGLGTGSTMRHFIDQLGKRVAEGLDIIGVPTSEATRAQAKGLGIPLLDEKTFETLDLAIDGTDEFDPAFNLIKGGGGAHLREKIVAKAAKRFFVIADEGKQVERLGAFPLPLEVLAFGGSAICAELTNVLRKLGYEARPKPRLSPSETPVLSDSGHIIYDVHLGAVANPEALAEALDKVPGLIEHGLFVGMADKIFVAGSQGVSLFENHPVLPE